MTSTQAITASQVKDIKTAFATLKPQKVTLDGNRAMTVKEAIFALAPTLERMKKRGFDITELVEKLHEKGIPVKAPTLAKYLNEFRRGKGKKAEGKTDTPPPPEKPTPVQATVKPVVQRSGGFEIRPDIPLHEL